MILKRLIRVLRTHVFKVDVDHLIDSTLSPVNNSETELNGNIFEGLTTNDNMYFTSLR